MPISFHVYQGSEFSNINKTQATLFRKKKKTKHSFEWVVCLKNNELELIDFEVSLRGMSKTQIKELDMFIPGQQIHFELIKKLQNKKWRVCNITS